ncbi:amidohydrolase [Cognatitamlana onchidii]|uniref:amidohydrolase n=1 Tax=Cognatitamlana onchidii TaxID=2562860 RepID=UPI0010A5B83E|nr:amidohydrolase [Algibacter onchidii]
MKKANTYAVLLLLTIAIFSCKSEPKKEAADTVFTNGKIYTINEAQPWAEAVAVKENKIVFVGSSEDAKAYTGENTKVTDLKGKMVLPGFVDAHIHSVGGGMIASGIDLQTDDKEELFIRLKKYIADNPELEVIRGYGVRFNIWNENWPTAAMLDDIESEKPIILITIDGHGGWANSKALEMAGIDKDTPEPAPGFSFFLRDSQGNPTGWIIEVPAYLEVLLKLDDILSVEGLKKNTTSVFQRFAAAGLTSIQDLGMGPLPGFEVLTELEKEGNLLTRVQGVYYWNDKDIDPIPLLQELNSKYNTELIKANRLKVNMDGGDDKHNGLYVEPYSDKPNLVPEPIIPYEVINDVVKRADALGFDISCHCFGDLAVRKMLDAYELAIKENKSWDRHHTINHGVLIHEDDYARFGELGIAYETTGAWMSYDPLNKTIATKRLGAERVSNYFPVNEIDKSGGLVAFGSDWPASGYVSEYRPLVAIQSGITRQLPGRENEPPLGGEAARIPLELALKMQTINAAKAIGMDKEVGSLEVGKKADLVILENNLFDIDVYDISKTKVVATMMNGKYTYQMQ